MLFLSHGCCVYVNRSVVKHRGSGCWQGRPSRPRRRRDSSSWRCRASPGCRHHANIFIYLHIESTVLLACEKKSPLNPTSAVTHLIHTRGAAWSVLWISLDDLCQAMICYGSALLARILGGVSPRRGGAAPTGTCKSHARSHTHTPRLAVAVQRGTYTRTRALTRARARTHAQTHRHTDTDTQTHTQTHTHTHKSATHTHMRMHKCTQRARTHTHTRRSTP